MSRPRVFYILGSLEANDTGDEIVTLLGRLSRAQFEPRVVALGGRDDLREQILQMKVRSYPLGLSGLFGTWIAVSRVRKLLERLGADVVHGYGSWGGAVAELAAPRGVAVVRTVTRPPNHSRDMRGRLLRFLERRARRKVGTHFVVPNEGSRGLAIRAYGALDGRVTVLPTSVDVGGVRDTISRMSRENARILLGIGPKETAFVLVTSFDSQIRMDEILTGFATALLERPELRLFVVGSGRHEGSTRWKAEELSLGDSVIFLGRGTESGPVWAATDFVIDATPWSGWSRAALVAIAAGVPALKRQDGTDGWPEEMEDDTPMISAHPDRFAADLVRLAIDAELRGQVGRHAEQVAARVDVARVAEQLGELYEEIAESSGG
jgi:glycosyltransferase involved in cell wall biosynthesis